MFDDKKIEEQDKRQKNKNADRKQEIRNKENIVD